ncbi:aminoacetone oxidase family FAD-binding enzyme [Roseiconus nitratireducens]|uniref:Aminoacetone oxidase family FAD-binding enzyme n=1 Tax=Roseiconus nitratireducens TaxID=2605748 RepID=A0A5M6DF87_9BACT|nr:aminoacetone oxidase family FAD-binding enzyme [Roseiconus nitratireducens]KAA5546207.1 aminoacetone oxidase family FAD-binding enzyme [Roseiconus nitratireducens]
MERPKIVVIGAGAAGLMAAAEAAERGADVLLLEKNTKTGVKILMSGGTRCNITQDTDARGIASAFGKAGRFLQKSVGAFGPADVQTMFQQAGVATKTEATGKVFPKSDRALDVRDALQRRAIQAGTRLRLRSGVQRVLPDGEQWVVQTESEWLRCDRVIVTAGGQSWPGCGTTGDAYAWLRSLGHTIVPPRPALVPLVGGDRWTHDLSGLTLEDCVASVHSRHPSGTKSKPLISRRSSWLFTHFGFSGPAAMDVSGTLTAAASLRDVRLRVDLVPELAPTEIQSRLTDRSDGGRRGVVSIVNEWLPSRLAQRLVTAAGADTTVAQLSRPQLESMIQWLKQAEFPVSGTRGFAKAEVTAGGVQLSEVDPRTMQSRLAPGLYIAGEVLDVDGWIGGYNFQAAFSTGRAAGIHASGH